MLSGVFLASAKAATPNIFSDNFSENNMRLWTNTISLGGAIGTSSAIVEAGSTYSCAVSITSANEGSAAYAYENWGSSYSMVYYSFNVYFSSLPSNAEWMNVGAIGNSLSTSQASVFILNLPVYDGGAGWVWILAVAGGKSDAFSTQTVSAGVWYNVLLELDYTTGTANLIVNGVNVGTVSGQGQIEGLLGSAVTLGETYSASGANGAVNYYENVVVSNTAPSASPSPPPTPAAPAPPAPPVPAPAS